MQKIECIQYPLLGKLISQALKSDLKIHRNILMANHKGRITIYYSDGNFILECDTDGDHNPNEYYFFDEIERDEAYKILGTMASILGTQQIDQIKSMTDQVMNFFKTV